MHFFVSSSVFVFFINCAEKVVVKSGILWLPSLELFHNVSADG